MLDVQRQGRVATLTIDHPPINLLDLELMLALDAVGRDVADDPEISVVVLRSAVPGWFIAHADVELILGLTSETAGPPPEGLGFFHAMVDRFRTMPKLTVAVIDGIVRGGGCELMSSFDVRFASTDAVLGQPEVALGILPGGSGTQRLPWLIGRARALEVAIGCDDVDGATAERWGWVNRALPSDELAAFVDRFVKRVASFPPAAIAEAKAAIVAATPDPVPGLGAEAEGFARLVALPVARERMQAFMAAGGQTTELEGDRRSVQALLERLGDSA
jgi:enoyl-CoA hydratase/carnithine racemase